MTDLREIVARLRRRRAVIGALGATLPPSWGTASIDGIAGPPAGATTDPLNGRPGGAFDETELAEQVVPAPRPQAPGRARDADPPERGSARWSGGSRRTRLRSTSAARVVGTFWLAGLAGLIVLASLGAFLIRGIAERDAVSGARRVTVVLAESSVQPALSDAVLRPGSPAARRFATTVDGMVGGNVVRVRVWRPDGTVLFSDDRDSVGQRYALSEDQRAAFADNAAKAEVTHLDNPENGDDRALGRLLEVYAPLRTPGGQPLLFEAYYPYDAVLSRAHAIWRNYILVAVGALLIFELLQLPLAWRMARRLDEAHQDREQLLLRAISATDVERRRIAASLHDGPVQGLAGTAFALAALGDRLGGAGRDDEAGEVEEMAAALRGNVRALRTLLVELYPRNLRAAGLAAAVSDVTSPLRGQDVDVRVDLAPDLNLSIGAEALCFRVVQEACQNIAKHARARRVDITVVRCGDRVVLTVEDDGRGFDPTIVERRAQRGHLGLSLLADFACDAGATLEVASAAGAGTRVRLEAPA